MGAPATRQLPYAPLLRQVMEELCAPPTEGRAPFPDPDHYAEEILFGFEDLMSIIDAQRRNFGIPPEPALDASLHRLATLIASDPGIAAHSSFLSGDSWRQIRAEAAAILQMLDA